MVEFTNRWGHSLEADDGDYEQLMRQLLENLRTEVYAEPDNEHTQVCVANEHWAVTAFVSGLIGFDNIDLLEGEESDLPEEMYLRNIPDETLIAIWQAIVDGDRDSLLAHPWRQFDELPPYTSDYYRRKN